MQVPVVSLISRKKCGKTTIIEKLIPELKRRGYRVGTIKHDVHGFDIDHEGKDTWRHKKAGAETVVISSPWKISVIKDVQTEMSLDEITDTYFSDVDIIITEGFKSDNKPQIEIFQSTKYDKPIAMEDGRKLLGLMSDIPIDLGVPCYHLNDIDKLVDLIENTFLIPQGS